MAHEETIKHVEEIININYIWGDILDNCEARGIPTEKTWELYSPPEAGKRAHRDHDLRNRIPTQIVLISALAVSTVGKLPFFGSTMRFSNVFPKGF